ncbi:hypothetical protein CL631_02700 [bacterium]|jgi:glycosyltransferase involved in cell wall biosynthesis|nr:hypothetical protein [bacterium]MDP6659892.1 glycosyltransferase [Candidatus Paceibacterota bacterium]|tara:strand:- start:47075 stop:48121 length:1047 start_codon:yes stop_codon:yes gene_type:complete
MRVLSIGSDRKLFEDGSFVCERTKKYGEHMEELHIVVFALKNLGFRKKKIGENITIYPTNSLTKFQYIGDAIKIARSIKYDRITTQDPFISGWAGVSISAKSKKPLQVQIHTDFLLEGFQKGGYINRFYVRMANHVLPKADCIRVVSERIKENIEARYKLKSIPRVLPIFVDIEAIKNAPKNEKEFPFQIAMSSRLEPEKNIGRAIKVLSRIVNERIGMVIVGEGGERLRLEKVARDLGIESGVLFKGWIQNPVPYIKSSDLFLQTSEFEGYGMSVVEALASGVPALSTDVGIAKEYGADVFETDEELKEKIERYIENGGMGELKNYPYKNEEEYIKKYVEMIEICGS